MRKRFAAAAWAVSAALTVNLTAFAGQYRLVVAEG